MWIPVEERKPTNHCEVLMYLPIEGYVVGYWDANMYSFKRDYKEFDRDGEEYICSEKVYPTHWALLEPPMID